MDMPLTCSDACLVEHSRLSKNQCSCLLQSSLLFAVVCALWLGSSPCLKWCVQSLHCAGTCLGTLSCTDDLISPTRRNSCCPHFRFTTPPCESDPYLTDITIYYRACCSTYTNFPKPNFHRDSRSNTGLATASKY